MSDGTIMLTCFRYFLDCPWPRLTGTKEAKDAKSDWVAVFIRDISARDALIWSVFAEAISAEGTFA